MSAPLESWKVLPHGQLTQIDDNVWTVAGTIHMPVGDFERRMTVARLRDGDLVVYSATALDEPHEPVADDPRGELRRLSESLR
jgi:hypothetical protein